MAQLAPFFAGHEELIHDISYDFYGKRLVTCSSDQHIKVFEKTERLATGDGSDEAAVAAASFERGVTYDGYHWELSDSWKAHDSTIVKVVWASPEFGQVIASCSYDASVRIWEEDPREPHQSGKRWKRKATISEFHGALYDIAFAPSHEGLKLASIDSEGMFHVHEAMDPNNLQYWTSLMPDESLVTKKASKNRQSSFALSWCPSMFFKEYIAVSAQESAYIYHKSDLGKYLRVAEFPNCKSLIRDIAWAPSMGRQFQLIAVASVDGYIRIFKVTKQQSTESQSQQQQTSQSQQQQPQAQQSQQGGGAEGPSSSNAFDTSMDIDDANSLSTNQSDSLHIELISSLGDHRSEVWRVSWNITGTILASAGNDGNVRFWKASYSNEFQCMAVVTAKQRNDKDENLQDAL